MSSKRTIIISIVLAMTTLVVLLPQNLYKARHRPAKISCISALMTIEGAKASWALDNKKADDDEPLWSDLFGPSKPCQDTLRCPDGGTLTIGKVSEYPRCTIAGHVLP